MQKIAVILTISVSVIFSDIITYEPNAEIDIRIDIITQTLSAHSGVPAPGGFSQQPFDYFKMRSFLTEVEKSQNLTQTDKELLEILRNKFSGKNKIFGFEDGAAKRILVNLDLTGDFRTNYKNEANLDAKGMISPRISANLNVVSFYSKMDIWTQFRSDTVWRLNDYQPFHGQTYNIVGNDDSSGFRALDAFRGGISAQFKNARIDVAVDNLTSGPATYNRLILNAVDKPLFYTRIMLDFKKMQYYQIFGMLRELNLYNKYLYYHRLQFPFLEGGLTFGLSESIISGSTGDDETMFKPHSQHLEPSHLNRDRKVEPVYMIPFMPYVFAEHYGGDLDNKQIALDFEIKLPQTMRWYIEFLIDDCQSPLEMFNDRWGNKWAVTLGTQWFPEIAGKNAVFGLEYCRVEPWVYTHFYGVANNYEHYGKNIGAELGPNSAQIRGLAQYYFSQKHGLQVEAIYNRFNRNVRGGNIGDVFVYQNFVDSCPQFDLTVDSEEKKFLGKDYQKSYEFSLSYLFRQFSRFEMKASAVYDNRKGAGMEFLGGFRF
ncbi:MAG: hypothetical protein LBH98_05610 [Chitinispirillales bacterium]|jgi:hypothetical protein|nr:hypothetical protein [Chitinispirillales bacterium]